jgi:hypothetical protein
MDKYVLILLIHRQGRKDVNQSMLEKSYSLAFIGRAGEGAGEVVA